VSFSSLLCCRTPNCCDCGLMFFLCFHFVMELQIVVLCDHDTKA